MTVIILSIIGIIILSINVILYFIGFAKHGRAYKIFTLYLLIICLIQVVMELLAAASYNNHFLSCYYLFAQFLLLSGFFYALFKNVNTNKSKVVIIISALTIMAVIVQYFFSPELYFTFNSFGFLATSLLLVVYSVLYLFEHLTKKLPFFYVTTGIFIYLVSSSLIFASAAAIVTFNHDVNIYIWNINGTLFILYQLLILWEWKKVFLPGAAK